MRTIINSQGCVTNPGPVGLTVHGDIIASEVDLLKEIKSLKEKEEIFSKKIDEYTDKCNQLEDKIEKLTNLFEKKITELKEKIEVLSELASKKTGRVKVSDSVEDK